MDKNSWLRQLKSELTDRGVTKVERSAVLNYYNEMYQDKLEDGLTEKEILSEFGFPQDVADSVLNDERKEKRWSDGDARVDADILEDIDDALEEDIVVEEKDVEVSVDKPKKKGVVATAGSTVSTFVKILLFIVFGALIFAFYASATLTVIAGIGVIVSSFMVIKSSFGAFLLVFGIGFVVFAIAEIFSLFGNMSVKAIKKIKAKE